MALQALFRGEQGDEQAGDQDHADRKQGRPQVPSGDETPDDERYQDHRDRHFQDRFDARVAAAQVLRDDIRDKTLSCAVTDIGSDLHQDQQDEQHPVTLHAAHACAQANPGQEDQVGERANQDERAAAPPAQGAAV